MRGGINVTKLINDSSLKQAGLIYQFLIALKDCFELNQDDILQIETNGDISIINSDKGRFQKEVKHHFGNRSLSERDEEVWKTLANWYVEYDTVKRFSNFILCTTANISPSSPFFDWNKLEKEEKLKRIINIGKSVKDKEEKFRKQYNRIFSETFNEINLLNILGKFTIESSQKSIAGISNEFSKYIGHIPKENRDSYIGALLGEILIKIKKPPHKWDVNKASFEKILQSQSSLYVKENEVPLPIEFAESVILEENTITILDQKKFVLAIREIKYDTEISLAMDDYWKTNMTIAKYFQDNPMYLTSLDTYKDDLEMKLKFIKKNHELDVESSTEEEKIKISKRLYNGVMAWDANDFGSIIRNQGFFQRGVIHDIVDEKDFKWKVEGK